MRFDVKAMPLITHFKNFIKPTLPSKNNNRVFDQNETQKGKRETTEQPNGTSKSRVYTKSHNVAFATASPKLQHDSLLAAKITADRNESYASSMHYPGLESFKLLEKMGEGAFSKVYKAIDKENKQKLAIKVVRKYELNAHQRASTLKEVHIMRATNHPSIVKFYGFRETYDYYFLFLELIEGGEIFNRIVELTYFSEELSRHVIIQVASAIKYLHQDIGVVHRDIKPENLLFEAIPIFPLKSRPPYAKKVKEDEGEFVPGVGGGGIGRVKLADFGLSKVIWEDNAKTPCGTVGYAAPEIVRDQHYGKSVDMWALGCVLYTMLCGFPPFFDQCVRRLTEKVARGEYSFLSPWWDDISTSAKDLVSHLLCVDPENRYNIDEFFEHPWIRNPPIKTYKKNDRSPRKKKYDHLFDLYIPSPPLDDRSSKASNRYKSANCGTGGTDQQHYMSPGLTSLKEAFEVSYAWHRKNEEYNRQKKLVAALENPTGGRKRGWNNVQTQLPRKKASDENVETIVEKMDQLPLSDKACTHAAPLEQVQLPPQQRNNAPALESPFLYETDHRVQPANGDCTLASKVTEDSLRQQQLDRLVGFEKILRTGFVPFELSLEHNTLLERRRKRAAAKENYGIS
ncbi:uncharacterized protein VTP21DRAFT_8697 [Calcarisporiella thermophila]|uniref:uncharacterized protein n=1 Tax=Calcarisporiella thermophila TaxID=911321 RepID=UPI003742ED66